MAKKPLDKATRHAIFGTMTAAGIFLVSGFLSVAGAQSFDIGTYCRRVSDAVGGSYVIGEGCRQQERTARDQLFQMSTPARIQNYGTDVAQAVGGSYQIMLGCVEQELAAKSRLGD